AGRHAAELCAGKRHVRNALPRFAEHLSPQEARRGCLVPGQLECDLGADGEPGPPVGLLEGWDGTGLRVSVRLPLPADSADPPKATPGLDQFWSATGRRVRAQPQDR